MGNTVALNGCHFLLKGKTLLHSRHLNYSVTPTTAEDLVCWRPYTKVNLKQYFYK